jgi:hypothetical protein
MATQIQCNDNAIPCKTALTVTDAKTPPACSLMDEALAKK